MLLYVIQWQYSSIADQACDLYLDTSDTRKVSSLGKPVVICWIDERKTCLPAAEIQLYLQENRIQMLVNV